MNIPKSDPMKNVFPLLLLALTLFGCSGATKLTVSYIQEDAISHNYNKIAVVAMVNSDPNRLAIEEAVANQFKSVGTNSLSTFFLFPLANRADVVADMNVTPEQIKEYVKEKVAENKIDALMIITLLDTRTVERYVDRSANVSLYFNPMYPTYGYPYYDYYWYSYNTVSNAGYYTTSTTYFLETNLYDVKSEKLIWSGQTKTENISSVDAEAPKFAKVIVNDIVAKGVVSGQ